MSLDISLKTYRHTNSIFLFSLFSLQKLPCLLIETTAAFTLYYVILNSSNLQTGNPTIFLFLYLTVPLCSWLTFAYMVVAFTTLLWYVWLWRAYCIYAFRQVCLAKVSNDFILDKKTRTCFHAAFSVEEPLFRQRRRSVRKYTCYILREILCSAVLRLNKLGGYSSLFNITLFLPFASLLV